MVIETIEETINKTSLIGKTTIKAQLGEEIKKISIHNDDLTYDELILIMQRIFSKHIEKNDNICLKYKDDDGDYITLSDDSELNTALENGGSLKLLVTINDKEVKLESKDVKKIRKELQSMRERINYLLDSLEVMNFETDVEESIIKHNLDSKKKITNSSLDKSNQYEMTNDMSNLKFDSKNTTTPLVNGMDNFPLKKTEDQFRQSPSHTFQQQQLVGKNPSPQIMPTVQHTHLPQPFAAPNHHVQSQQQQPQYNLPASAPTQHGLHSGMPAGLQQQPQQSHPNNNAYNQYSTGAPPPASVGLAASSGPKGPPPPPAIASSLSGHQQQQQHGMPSYMASGGPPPPTGSNLNMNKIQTSHPPPPPASGFQQTPNPGMGPPQPSSYQTSQYQPSMMPSQPMHASGMTHSYSGPPTAGSNLGNQQWTGTSSYSTGMMTGSNVQSQHMMPPGPPLSGQQQQWSGSPYSSTSQQPGSYMGARAPPPPPAI